MLCLVGGSHQEPNDHRLLHINDVKFDHMDLVVATRFFFCKDIFFPLKLISGMILGECVSQQTFSHLFDPIMETVASKTLGTTKIN